jgi:hypothetical protein
MGYIKTVVPLEGHRLLMEMESGSCVTADLTAKLHTMKYRELADPALFSNVKTDGNYVIWGNGRVKLTANELMEVVLTG